jgi:hypothetical protein
MKLIPTPQPADAYKRCGGTYRGSGRDCIFGAEAPKDAFDIVLEFLGNVVRLTYAVLAHHPHHRPSAKAACMWLQGGNEFAQDGLVVAVPESDFGVAAKSRHRAPILDHWNFFKE